MYTKRLCLTMLFLIITFTTLSFSSSNLYGLTFLETQNTQHIQLMNVQLIENMDLVNASSIDVQPLSTRTQIILSHYLSHPSVGDIDVIHIYSYWWEWGWSDGYLVVLLISITPETKLIDVYDSPKIHLVNPGTYYQEIDWYFFPPGGVEGDGHEFRPYVKLKYLASGTINVIAKIYQVWVIAPYVFYIELRASVSMSWYISA